MSKNEDMLINIIEELIDKRGINLEDTPKDLGLDSLQMIILVAKIETKFDIEIPDDGLDLENFKTIGSILEMINKIKKDNC